MFECTRPGLRERVKAPPVSSTTHVQSENSSSVPTCQMFCREKPFNCQLLFLFCHLRWFPSNMILWAELFVGEIFSSRKDENFPTPLVLLQNCPTAKKLLFVRGSSWPVTLTRDNVFLPCYTTCFFYLEHLNMKITLKVSTRRETNRLSSRLVDKTRTDVCLEFSGKFVAKIKTAKFEDNCQNETLTDVIC